MAKKPSVVKDGDGDASHLNLWEVTVPTANFFFFTEPPTETPLANTTPLSELFLPVVQRGFLHVVVQVVPRQAPGQAPEHGMRTPRTMNESECFLPFRLSLTNDLQHIDALAVRFWGLQPRLILQNQMRTQHPRKLTLSMMGVTKLMHPERGSRLLFSCFTLPLEIS